MRRVLSPPTAVDIAVQDGPELADGVPHVVGVGGLRIVGREHRTVGDRGEHARRQRADDGGELGSRRGRRRRVPVVDDGVGELVPAAADALQGVGRGAPQPPAAQLRGDDERGTVP